MTASPTDSLTTEHRSTRPVAHGRDRDQEHSGRGESNRGELIDKVIKIRRCAAVVKGGRRFSFTAMVVVGNGRGKVGWGYGKANEVPPGVEKAVKDGSPQHDRNPASKGARSRTRSKGHFGAAQRRAAAGQPRHRRDRRRAPCGPCARPPASTTSSPRASARPIPINLVKATIDALKQLRTRHEVERLRGVSLT